MATTAQPPQTKLERPERKPAVGGPGGGFLDLTPESGNLRRLEDRPPEPVRTGIWVGLAAIAMSFAALTSALLVREGSANDWHHLVIPPILYFNTLVLLASSLTLEVARGRVGAFMRGEGAKSQAILWLGTTLALGFLFLVGQYVAWLQLRARGLYLATNPNSSFFYLLTAVHAAHVLGGLGGLARVMTKVAAHSALLRRRTMDATSYYWHFMGMLWIYLLFVLWSKL